jgi:diphthamide synthase (EF-2-diphthine--ammonia ligase)
MIQGGLQARLTCIDSRKLEDRFVGRSFDESLLRELPTGVDPCGENGEFHTFASAGPMFQRSIDVSVGEKVLREGFLFADLTLANIRPKGGQAPDDDIRTVRKPF